MCAFVATNKAPGVYIDEVQLPGAISGVGTSTAAFVGPALSGPIGVPTRLANWTEFLDAFGGPAGPYIWQPPIYVTHAVQGFFAEGGADCWFVRIGTAKRAELALKDRSGGAGNDTLVVSAKQEGTQPQPINVEVRDASIATTAVTRAEAAITGALNSTVTLGNAADAAKFLADDVVHVDDGTNNEDATVASSSGTAITLKAPLAQTYGAGTVRLADLAAGSKSFRVDSTTGIEPGSNLSLDQQGANNEVGVVAGVDAAGTVTLSKGLTNAYTLGQADAAVDVKTQEFTLIIGTDPPFENLSMDPRHSRYFGSAAQSTVADVAPVDPPNVAPPPENMPMVAAAAPLAGGADDDPGAALGDANAFKGGIDALRKIDEVNILCVPDRTDQDVQAYMIAHCDDMQDRFTILDPRSGSTSALIRTQRDALVSDRGVAALYYPQIVISRPVGSGRITVPPSGHVAGLYARTDNDRGVFKAPANAALRSALDLERRLADEDQGPLNEHGVNVIRSFPGRGIRVWGARTISENVQWRYVNVRRLLLFIEESIQEATQFVVFEPNEPALWEQVKRQVTDFLTRLWSDGALFGVTADQAFRVRVDEELNPPSVRQLGMLVIEVVIYPTTPAEFVVFRIIQQPGGPVVQE
jgi:phage tail sheath protein FI